VLTNPQGVTITNTSSPCFAPHHTPSLGLGVGCYVAIDGANVPAGGVEVKQIRIASMVSAGSSPDVPVPFAGLIYLYRGYTLANHFKTIPVAGYDQILYFGEDTPPGEKNHGRLILRYNSILTYGESLVMGFSFLGVGVSVLAFSANI
jgi:hypothetical protein